MTPTPVRSKRRQAVFIVLAGVLAFVGALVSGYYFTMRPVPLRIAVGPPNSDDVRVIQALAQAFSREHNGIRLRLVIADGALGSANALASGKADLAVIRGDLDVPKDAQAVAVLRKNVAVLWVPAKPKAERKKGAAKITKLADIAGKRIGIIGRTQANVNLLRAVLQQYGIDATKLDVVQFSTSEVTEAIKGHKVDVFLAAGPVNSKITADAIAESSRDGAPLFLPIDAAEAIAQNHPMYESADIPAGAFGGSPPRPDDEVKTISFAHHIVARKSLSEATVSAFTKQLFAVRQSLMNDFPLTAKIETPDTDKDAAIPAHPGAAAFVDGEEKTFLDRYSDYIWWSLMAFSAFGSIGAWLASYLRRDERNTNSSLRERLLDMIATARKSDSMDELDALQAEADDILRDTLTCFENGTIEEGTLTAFNIALEQFHNAVADRKALLLTPPLTPVRPQRPQVV